MELINQLEKHYTGRKEKGKNCIYCGFRMGKRDITSHNECTIRKILTDFKGTSLDNIYKTIFPELYQRIEREVRQ